MTSFILYTVFINLLIAVLVAFLSYHVAGNITSGGFWFSTVITLVGAYVGTFFGVFLQIMNVDLPGFLVQFLFPVVFSVIFLFLFSFFDHFNHQ